MASRSRLLPALLLLPACQTAAPQSIADRLRDLARFGPIVVAHRGDSGSYPENTVPAFTAAVRAKAGMVELDYRHTRDHALICLHDATLDRTTNAVSIFGAKRQAIAKRNARELAALDAGSWKSQRFRATRLPTLAVALDCIGETSIPMIERKAGDADRLAKLLRARGATHDVLVQSFDWNFLRAFHALAPEVALAALGGTRNQPDITDAVLDDVQAMGCTMIHWRFSQLTAAAVERCHARGLLVCTYTIDKVPDFAKAIELGVDAITTNQPQRLQTFLAKRRQSGSRK